MLQDTIIFTLEIQKLRGRVGDDLKITHQPNSYYTHRQNAAVLGHEIKVGVSTQQGKNALSRQGR